MAVAMFIGLVVIGALARQARPRAYSTRQGAAHPLRYRVWAGLTLWLGASTVDLALVATVPAWRAAEGGPAGALSLGGFVVAFAWSMFAPERRR